MAWEIIRTETRHDGKELVHKRWAPQPGEKPRKVRKTAVKRQPLRHGRAFDEEMAGKYARWLAERDHGIDMSDAAAKPLWCGNRIRAVKLAGTAANLTVEIPHWDWTPDEPVEMIEPLPADFEAQLEDDLLGFAFELSMKQAA
jgi:hypothetical protein